MSHHTKNHPAPRGLTAACAALGFLALAAGLVLLIRPSGLRLPAVSPAAAALTALGGAALLPALAGRRGLTAAAATVGALLLCAAVGLQSATVYVAGRLIPVNTAILDLSGAGVEDCRPLGRLHRLKYLDLSGNPVSDVSALRAMTSLGHLDLTGTNVSAGDCAALRHALSGCFILCEAEDDETEDLVLSGRSLPDFDTLLRVLRAHTALKTLDLRATGLTDAETDAIRAALPAVYVRSDVTVGGRAIDSASGTVTVPDTDFDAIQAILARFDHLTGVTLTGRAMTPGETRALLSAYPDAAFTLDVSLCGAAFSLDAADVDLSACALSEGWLGDLALFGGLQRLTLPAVPASDYRAAKAAFPGAAVTAPIALCGGAFDAGSASVDLSGLTLPEDTDALVNDLRAFEALTDLSLPETTPQRALALTKALPGVAVSYRWLGQAIDPALTEVDLRGGGACDMDALSALLTTAPALTAVYLDAPAPGTRRALAEIEGVAFAYDFTILGRGVSTAGARRVSFDRFELGDLEALALEKPLSLAGPVSEVDMYASRLSRPVMDELFDRFGDTFFGWTFDICGGRWTLRTDITAFSTLKYDEPPDFSQDDFAPLRYCKNLRGIDLGHNAITDIGFLRSFPHLKLLILADNRITDISPLADLRELEYVELFMNEIADFSPLKDMDALLDLNLCYNLSWNRREPQDITPLTTLDSLQRLWISGNNLTADQQAALKKALPDCEIRFTTTKGSTSDGWREHRRYYIMHGCFTSREYRPFS